MIGCGVEDLDVRIEGNMCSRRMQLKTVCEATESIGRLSSPSKSLWPGMVLL